jgi:hypothetical protein
MKSAKFAGVHGRLAIGIGILVLAVTASAAPFRITVKNVAPADGVRITPLWFGIHDGSFDTFDSGSPASAQLERLAEDGDPSFISGAFTGVADGVVFGPVTAPGQPPIYHPGESSSVILDLDPSSDLYLSYLSMVIPSNDAFIGNSDPTAYQISSGGKFQPLTIDVFGSTVWDAGTEVNDEIPINTPLLGQMAPNTGLTEGGLVQLHGGFLPGGNVLSAFPGADFTTPAYRVAQISVVPIPEPASLLLVSIGAAAVGLRRRSILKTR